MTKRKGDLPIILLVDDDQVMSAAASQFLQHNGFDTIVAHTGEDAVRELKANVFSAAVVDIHLPDMTGLELTQRLRSRLGKSFPIIVCSGDGSMNILNELSTSGANYFFHKPVNRHLLLQRLKELLADGVGA